MATQIAVWWLVVQILGLIGLPLTTFLFRALPDRGYAFSKSLGLLLTGYGAWLLAMFGLGTFGAPLLVIVALLVGGLGLALNRTLWHESADADAEPPERWAGLRLLLGPQTRGLSWRVVLGYEIVFLVALIALAWMRSYNPHPWGTERPMDFAFFNAIRNSAAFPPHDPWLAGYSINYYYFGYLLMAMVALLSGLDPAVAYNLSLALIFALTALGVAGVLYNLITLSSQPRRVSLGRSLIAILGIVLVLLAGNQAGVLQVIVGSERVVALDGPQLVSAVGQALDGAEEIELAEPIRTADFGEFDTLQREDRLANFNWWWPSRVLWDSYPPDEEEEETLPLRNYSITEFPFFSFWLGDMHPHVMALPFGLLAMGLALATLARPALPTFARGRLGWAELLLTGLVLGSLYIINSWDLPTYILLYLGALVLLYVRLARQGETVPWLRLGQQAGLALVAAVVLFLPFYLTFRSLVGSAAPLIDLPVLGRLTQIISPFTVDKSGIHSFLIIFGLFLLPLSAFVYLNAATHNRGRSSRPAATLGIVAGQVEGDSTSSRYGPAHDLIFSPWVPPLLLVIGLLLGFPLLALLGLGLFAFRQALRRAIAPAEAFALLVVALGCAICFGTELIYLRDIFGRRINTIFKFYYQTWLLWGTVAAYALWWMMTQTGRGQRIAAYVVSGFFVVLLSGALLYPAINLRDMVTQQTQVGLAGQTPREADPAEREAILWLREYVAPGSVVLEMVGPGGGGYNGAGYAGVSASTGLPTVMGWVGHQEQWRGGDPTAFDEIKPRQQDVETIYSTMDLSQARALLEQYRVSYIYIGRLERQHYSAESLSKFNQLAQPVFQNESVVIYPMPE